ncbi:hypothetical protein NAP1_07175 [Erythrobacter sp. NAP1]|uniref:hypothetical protein n=1 Tax=Erythrobacter sp. NAP1 TaxID=237727 RepID=UPI0000686A53|nr:hypothetical protein [Erythrobacter sp. NAP1]EAQ30541.1 hypothetical protein NAP1_07175 [Erythrobacter sp. NAP1]
MANSDQILSDSRWLPHALDPATGAITFIKLERERLSASRFLADVGGEEGRDVASVPLAEMAQAQIAQGPLHFIFHTAFCRSTLLARALEQPGISAGLSEPGIIASLVNAGPQAKPAIAPVMALLSRSWSEGEAVFVKPTNHANAIAPALMEAVPGAKAVVMTNPLPAFLAAVVRKGMLGRRWARQLYLEMMGYAGMDLGMDGREQFSMTDLQAGALAWFLNQRFMHGMASRFGDRVRTLDGDRFGEEPAETLAAIGAFTGVPITQQKAEAIASGPVFASDAKTGEDYATKAARDAKATSSAVVEDEIAKLEEWIAMIAGQAGLTVPIKQTLF